MAELYTPTFLSGDPSATAINTNLQNIADALNQCLARFEYSGNQLEDDIDLNSKRLINVGEATNAFDAVSLKTATEIIGKEFNALVEDVQKLQQEVHLDTNKAATSASSASSSVTKAEAEINNAVKLLKQSDALLAQVRKLAASGKVTSVTFESMKDMLQSHNEDGATMVLKSFWKDKNSGGGEFYFDSSLDKAQANGVNIFDPDALGDLPSDPNPDSLKTFFTNNGSNKGKGCLVRLCDPSVMTLEYAGALADGEFNNTPSFVAISDYVRSRNGYSAIAAKPSGQYIYEQWQVQKGDTRYGTPFSSSFYGCTDIFQFRDMSNVDFMGFQCTFKLADGTHFGRFDDHDGSSGGGNANGGGRFLRFQNAVACSVDGVNWDGNLNNHVLGGRYGDTGWQIPETGLYIAGASTDIHISNSTFKRGGLDGVEVSVGGSPDVNPNITFDNVSATENARNGLSLTGGYYIKWSGGTIGYTGRGKFYSAPGSCIDFEPEGDSVWGCEFTNVSVIGGKNSVLNFVRGGDHKFFGGRIMATDSEPVIYNTTDATPAVSFHGSHLRGHVAYPRFNALAFFDSILDDNNTEKGFENLKIPSDRILGIVKAGSVFKNLTIKIYQPTSYAMTDVLIDPRDMDVTVVLAYDASTIKSKSDFNNSPIGPKFAGHVHLKDEIVGSFSDDSFKLSAYATPSNDGPGNTITLSDNGHFDLSAIDFWKERAGVYQVTPDHEPLVDSIRFTSAKGTDPTYGAGGTQIAFGRNPTNGHLNDDKYVTSGSIVFPSSAPGDTAYWRCKTSGVPGSTAVFEKINVTTSEVS